MKSPMKLKLLILGSLLITCSDLTSTTDDNLGLDNSGVEIHNNLLKYKKANNIEGLAFAIFDNKEVLYSECVGKSTYGFQITEETLFSIQSISKNFTALAVMLAVQDGLLILIHLYQITSPLLKSIAVLKTTLNKELP